MVKTITNFEDFKEITNQGLYRLEILKKGQKFAVPTVEYQIIKGGSKKRTAGKKYIFNEKLKSATIDDHIIQPYDSLMLKIVELGSNANDVYIDQEFYLSHKSPLVPNLITQKSNFHEKDRVMVHYAKEEISEYFDYEKLKNKVLKKVRFEKKSEGLFVRDLVDWYKFNNKSDKIKALFGEKEEKKWVVLPVLEETVVEEKPKIVEMGAVHKPKRYQRNPIRSNQNKKTKDYIMSIKKEFSDIGKIIKEAISDFSTTEEILDKNKNYKRLFISGSELFMVPEEYIPVDMQA